MAEVTWELLCLRTHLSRERPRRISRQKFPKRTRILSIPSKPYSFHSVHSAVGSRMNGMIFRSFRKRNSSQKNTNTVYSEYSYSRIVAKARALSDSIVRQTINSAGYQFFFFLFLNLAAVSKNSTPGNFIYIWHLQRIEIACEACVSVAFSFSSPEPTVLNGRGERKRRFPSPLSPASSVFSLSPHFARVRKYETRRLFSAENSTETLATQATATFEKYEFMLIVTFSLPFLRLHLHQRRFFRRIHK